MIVGILSVELRIPGNSSLKGKRKVLLSLKTKIRNKFPVAVAEVDNHDKWQRTTLGIASVGKDKRSVNSVLSKVMAYVEQAKEAELIDYQMELI